MAFVSHRNDAEVQTIESTIARLTSTPLASKSVLPKRSAGPAEGLATKMHAAVDAIDSPMRLALAPGLQHDCLSAIDLLDSVQAGGTLLADEAYDSNAIRPLIFLRARGRTIRRVAIGEI